MGKVIGVLLFVVAIWAASEFAAGTSPFSDTQRHAEQRSNAAAAGVKVGEAYEAGAERREALLAE